MEKSKAKIETQLKLLDLAERETQKVIARNRTSEIERHLNHVKRKLEMVQYMNYVVLEFMVCQWRANREFGRMVKSVGRKGVTFWCFGSPVEERSKSDNEKRRSREAEGGREAWREVSKTDGRRLANWEEEAGN